MMSKAPRWTDTVVNTKINKPTQKKGGKQAASSAPVCSGGKQAGSTTSKTSISAGRSNSLGNRGGDSTAAVRRVGGSLERGSLSHQGCDGHQTTKQASRSARPALCLSSSRSFSSLHTTSLSAAPFMRSSRSLSRLDQRSTGDDSDCAAPSSQVKNIQTTGKKILYSGQQAFSVEQIRDKKDQCHGDNTEKMKTSCSPQPSDLSSSLVSTAASHHHKGKKETRDGVYMLCAMTSGMKRNWVQAVLKNVRPSPTYENTSAISEQKTKQLQEYPPGDWTEDSDGERQEQETKPEPETLQSSADGDSSSSQLPVSSSASSAPSLTNPPDQTEEDTYQCKHLVEATQTGVTDISPCIKGTQGDSSAPSVVVSNDNCFHEDSNMQSSVEQSRQLTETKPQREDQQISINTAGDCKKDEETLPREPQTAQLVKELEQTQRELSRLQQLNRNLQDELQQEREWHSSERLYLQNDTNSSSGQALTFQRLQKINHDLHSELEALKRSQEEAREAELRRRVDLLAQQAQLLVTGDATALAQAHLEKDRRRFQEQQADWERCKASLKSQLNVSEEQRKEAESRLSQLRQELQSYHSLQQEAEQLRKHLQDVSTQFHAYEEAQAQKEGRLQKHLTVLQASQDRERRSLTANLAQAEQHSQELQERLDRAEQQVESLHKTQTLTKEIEEAQRQLQEELARTVSALQLLQEEREQLDLRCQELQNQLSEADREVNRLQGHLKTDETHYYNLEHSYERVCEELQVASGKVLQKETETQEMREGYERLLDRKEQELNEVLLKMEVLGNSLEETEVKLNEVLKACSCASSQLDESSEPVQRDERTTESFIVNESRAKLSNSSNATEVIQVNSSDSHECARTRSRSIDASYPFIVTAGDDPERFMSVIQSLETKLYVTEEKLRDITQRLEEHQSHTSCQDPQLCSQLTQTRAAAQHLSLLLHSQAKQSHRFAQETENRCRMLVGRFQVALNIIQACRERLQATPINLSDLERQLATVAACLQQGEKDAEKQQHESHNASKGEYKILNDEKLAGAENNITTKSKVTNIQGSTDNVGNVGKCLVRELFVVEKMVSIFQNQCVVSQLSSISRENEGDVANRYKNIISQIIALRTGERTQFSNEIESAICRACAEAELIYAALKFQQQYESVTQDDKLEVEHQRTGLADISPSELAPYEEQVQVDSGGLEEASIEKKQSDDRKVETEKKPEWLERLISSLQRRAKFLQQLCQDISGDNIQVSESSMDHCEENNSAVHTTYMEEAKLIYLSHRLALDLEQQLQQVELLQNKLEALCKDQDSSLIDEQEAYNHTLCQLQEDNTVLREELERAEHKIISVETGNQRLLEDIKNIEDYHEERMHKLETEFQEKIKELQQIHEEEMKDLHSYYTKSCVSKDKQTKSCTEATLVTESTCSLPAKTLMGRKTKEDIGIQMVGSDSEVMREAYQKDLQKIQESCDQEFTAMEEMHKKLIGDLHQQHQKEVAELLKEKDQLLQEETAATMTAIVAMRRAHKQELERSRQVQHNREGADNTQLRIEYEKEIQLLHKELEMLSVQHTEKCLENSQLNQKLQEERKSMIQYQKENQELKKKQRENDEMSQLHFSLNGKPSHVVPQVNNFYEMEVILRAREAEMQFLRQESHSLREELKLARMDKIYAQNKLKALCTNNQDEPQHVNKLGEDFQFTTLTPSRQPSGQSHEVSATNTHKAAFPKKTEKPSLMRQIRAVRSKSLKEGLSLQERMKLFESF